MRQNLFIFYAKMALLVNFKCQNGSFAFLEREAGGEFAFWSMFENRNICPHKG
jgi:hypothetical protein